MKCSILSRVTALVLVLAGVLASAAVKVDVDRNDNDDAGADFKFKNVPSPSRNSAASAARFELAGGDRDANGGGLDVLHDGRLPAGPDEPAKNFFFSDGTKGGRIIITLDSAIDVKQVNTYSWHTDTRAAQVYDLYGSDATFGGFNPALAKDADPLKCGWKLIAKVDTRPKAAEPGGQYGVSISDSSGSLGKFRYLLLAVSPTESNDSFGNTFYSEIDVVDAKELIIDPFTAERQPRVKLVEIGNGKYTASINTTETPELTDWAEKRLAPTVVEWYPKLVDMLPSQGYTAPTHFSITFRKDKKGVADTSGTRINCAADWFKANLNGEGKGAVVHEMAHVVQRYYGFGGQRHPNATPNPGWLVEGVCDYIRWYKFETEPTGAAIGRRGFAAASYDGNYRITANFLNWTIDKYDKNLIAELNVAMREGHYTADIWPKLTGKSVQTLNEQWKSDLARSLRLKPDAPGN